MKSLSKTRDGFYWDRLRSDVRNWCRECQACGARKEPKTRTKGRLKRYNVGAPFERMALDILGLFPIKTKDNREGPYTVVKKLKDVVYRVQMSPNTKPKLIHINRLAPYRATDHSSMLRDCREVQSLKRGAVLQRCNVAFLPL
ncbi:hypothetical protein AVEN_219001-1 [Araneus ventricosus]|uniref:Uncharacterized protein n=1 Tax=Araneus ventricosus TaxID=182803 RepID=A0A4Y2CBZ8_ARAVE|nr:hypothetical protein AVEN_219001-1 [Araneus ventricosus]